MFADPIIEFSTTNQTFLQSNNIFDTIPDLVISVGFKPGVTDNPGKAALDGFRTIYHSARHYESFYGVGEFPDEEFEPRCIKMNVVR